MTQVMLFITQVNISGILQFFAGVWFLKQNLKIFTLLHFLNFILNFYVLRMGRYMVPRVKDNNLLGIQKAVSMDFGEELAREGR